MATHAPLQSLTQPGTASRRQTRLLSAHDQWAHAPGHRSVTRHVAYATRRPAGLPPAGSPILSPQWRGDEHYGTTRGPKPGVLAAPPQATAPHTP